MKPLGFATFHSSPRVQVPFNLGIVTQAPSDPPRLILQKFVSGPGLEEVLDHSGVTLALRLSLTSIWELSS